MTATPVVVAEYARFSDLELQDERSIPDQHRVNQQLSDRLFDCAPTLTFEDPGYSSQLHERPGLRDLIQAAEAHRFNVLVVESLDRLSREASDLPHLYKVLAFAGVRIFTVEEGREIDETDIASQGVQNAKFWKGLTSKTRRGLRGQIERGKSAGGISYGYRYDRSRLVTNKRGELIPERGELVIHPEDAAVVLRILMLYAAGLSPEVIAKRLNADGVPGPGSNSKRGATAWSPSTIYGNWRRGTGILNNELYIGKRLWNRQRFVRHPKTRKRVARLNPQSEWVIKDVRHLRIPGLTDELWQAVKARQIATRHAMTTGPVQGRRPKFLFSKLTRCGACGAGYNMSSRDRLRCFNNEKRGTCANTRTITRQELEGRVLRAMRKQLFSDDAFEAFCKGFREEQNRLRMEQRERIAATSRELDRVHKEIRGIIDAIKAGVPGRELLDEMEGLQTRKMALSTQLASIEQPAPLLHPSMADVYRTKVEQLAGALETKDDEQREAARLGLRALITRIVIPPGDGLLRVVGDLGEMLATAASARDGSALAASLKVVAGAGFEPATFGL